LLARPVGEAEVRPPKRGVSWREIKSALNSSS